MKRLLVLLVLSTLFGCCSKEIIVNDDFLNDLASEDNRLAGELYLDKYNKNLDSLTYESYLIYLKTNEAPSAKGLYYKIEKAKEHYFKTKKTGFLLTLFYVDENEIVCDNSGTSFIDSTHIYKPGEVIPSLKVFSEKVKF
jgi:hypothetical protein